MLSEDMDRARVKKAKLSRLAKGIKRKATIVLGDKTSMVRRPTLLGPILSNRFKGVSTGSSSSSSG